MDPTIALPLMTAALELTVIYVCVFTQVLAHNFKWQNSPNMLVA